MSARGPVPDLLRRITERRRQRLAEARGGGGRDLHEIHPPSDPQHPDDGDGPAPLTVRDNPFLAALTHPSRAHAGHPATPPSPAGQTPREPARASLATRASPADRPQPATSASSAAPASPDLPVHTSAAAPPGTPAIIAEVKMGSPRLGSLRGRVDPLVQARIYADNGAAALSVVVEPDFFFGSYELLADCRAASGLPVVAKDFVVDPLQLAWARSAGADAVLLIAALYEPEELARYARLARGLGLVPLVETHAAADLACLAGEPWELVGVNNRDLRTFEVDLERSIALLPSLPAAAVKVAESGIRDALDVALLADSGFDALLIGETLLLAADPSACLRALLGRAAAEA